ncbi:hypothetical protein KPA97_67355, partial [Burkholderia cenocepacia]|nr:hypothetical protein [Burkholderia cenocepacia]
RPALTATLRARPIFQLLFDRHASPASIFIEADVQPAITATRRSRAENGRGDVGASRAVAVDVCAASIVARLLVRGLPLALQRLVSLRAHLIPILS